MKSSCVRNASNTIDPRAPALKASPHPSGQSHTTIFPFTKLLFKQFSVQILILTHATFLIINTCHIFNRFSFLQEKWLNSAKTKKKKDIIYRAKSGSLQEVVEASFPCIRGNVVPFICVNEFIPLP
jgi:hypothetical protein